MSEINQENPDLLNELADGEDEFDVDLMACGCRYVAEPGLVLSVYDIARLYNLGTPELITLVGALVDAGNIEVRVLLELAEKASRGEIVEADPRAQGRRIRAQGREERHSDKPTED